MKKVCKKVVQQLLKFLAKRILIKYQPEVIGVTGSVGKTSTKEAIYTVLSHKYNVRRNIKNYNNEIGLPLTIIGASSGGSSVWGWCGAFVKALVLLLWKDKSYPEILVLEMAVDRIGDMSYLVELAPCKVGVVTNIGPVHLEYFKTLDKIAKEKSKIISHIDSNGWAIINADNAYTLNMKSVAKGRVLTYGIDNEVAQIRASEINLSTLDHGVSGDKITGLSFKLVYQGSTVPVFLTNILGEHLVYATLAGAAAGIIYDMNLLEISQALRLFQALPGRMHLLDGIKQSYIIDDTYNAAPASTTAAVKLLGKMPGRKIAVLADMLELADQTAEGHRQVGQQVFDSQVEILITVGERARMIAAEAERRGMDSDNVFTFSDTDRAGRFLQERIEKGDFILIKGSRGMHMEKIVKEVMANPLKAKELLVA